MAATSRASFINGRANGPPNGSAPLAIRVVRGALRECPTTRASLVAGLRRHDRRLALPAFWDAYRAPLLGFIRARTRCQLTDADEAIQRFFVSTLRPGFFATFDPGKGRFRSWLGTIALRFSHNLRRPTPEIVGREANTVEARLDGRQKDDAPGPDRAVDRAQVGELLGRALAQLRQRYAADHEEELFDELFDAVMGERRMTDDAARARVIGKSVGALKTARHKEKDAWVLAYHGCVRDQLAMLGFKRVEMTRILREKLDVFR